MLSVILIRGAMRFNLSTSFETEVSNCDRPRVFNLINTLKLEDKKNGIFLAHQREEYWRT